MPSQRKRSTLVATIVTGLALSLVATASASAAGPVLKGPKTASVLSKGSRPTFKVSDASRNARKYHVFMTISTTKKLSRKTGDLLRPKTNGQQIGTFTSMSRKGTNFSYKTENYTFATWFMNRPGKYYWQAYRIDCRVKSCHVHSKTRSFFVR